MKTCRVCVDGSVPVTEHLSTFVFVSFFSFLVVVDVVWCYFVQVFTHGLTVSTYRLVDVLNQVPGGGATSTLSTSDHVHPRPS